MADEKSAVIALVVRGRQESLTSWIKNCPLDIEIVETHHHDEGIVILSMAEIDGLRAGNYLALHRDTRKRIGKRRWKNTTPTEPEAAKSELTVPTETIGTGVKP